MTPERRGELVALRRARDLMDRRFAEPLAVAEIAASVYLSPAHFSRRFRATYGETPHAYLMTRRIERASALLRDGISVTDAATAVGVASPAAFSSRFAELMGMTPTAYRAASHDGVRALPDCAARTIVRRRRPSRISNASRTAPV